MVAGTERGVEAFLNSATTDKFTLGQTDKKIDLEIRHTYFKHARNDNKPHDGHIGSSVIVKNVGNVKLIDVKVYVDVDDNMPGFNALLYATDQHPSGSLGSNQAILHFGNLAPGETSVKKNYWWTILPKFPGVTGSKEREVLFHLYPMFTADYSQVNELFTSEAVVSNA